MSRIQPALNTPLPPAARLQGRVKSWLRVVLSQYVTNGLTVSLGLVLIMLAIFEAAGLSTQSRPALLQANKSNSGSLSTDLAVAQ